MTLAAFSGSRTRSGHHCSNHRNRLFAQIRNGSLGIARESLQEALHQDGNILTPFPPWRMPQTHSTAAVMPSFAEISRLHFGFFPVLVTRADRHRPTL